MTITWAHGARARKSVVTISIVLVVGAAIATGVALTGSSSPDFRTTTAVLADVQQTTSLTGTIEPVTQADLSFATSGTINAVDVTLGQKINEGSVLATLQTESLTAQVDQAESSLDNAKTTLDNDASPGGSMVHIDALTVQSDQSTLNNDQIALSHATVSNQASLSQAQQAVQSAQSILSTATLQLGNDQSSLNAAKAKESVDCQGDALAGSAVCAGDESTVASDQTQVANDQGAAASDQSQLTTMENNVLSTQLRNTETIQQDERQVGIDRAQLNAAESHLSTASSATYSNQLASDRAMVASAENSLVTARQNLADASLISPISGTVVAVNVTAGTSVTAAPSTVGSPSSSGDGPSGPAIEVVSPGTFEVQATATDAQVSTIKISDQAIIIPSGSYTPVLGTVTQVGSFASVSSSGAVTFPVVIGVKGSPKGLYEVVTAQLTLVVLQVKHVLSVASSAVHTLGPRHFVYLIEDDKQVEHQVNVGAIGGQLTQITSGLTAGEKVVLANLSSGISNTTNNNSGFGPCPVGQQCNVRIIGPGGGAITVHGNTGPKGG